MAITNSFEATSDGIYPSSDGRPVGESPPHVMNLFYLLTKLEAHFAKEPSVFVAGNMFVYYARGDRHVHVSPDVFVVRDIPRQGSPERRRYLVWEEGKGPDVVIELTSESTREEDYDDKMWIYREKLHVPEYFLFDPYGEYLDPPLQGHRLVDGQYQSIQPVDGRLPSAVLGLHLESDGLQLRLYDPSTKHWLPTPPEEREARQEAEAENDRLRRELEELRRRLPGQP
jgi:Uma2 family endonuclease